MNRTSNRMVRIERWGLGSLLWLGVVGCGGDSGVERPTPLAGEVPIEYPLELWDQGIEGRCLLKVRVNDLGNVDSVVVVESSGYSAFDSAAMEGARAMQFSPARRSGKRIDVWAQVPVEFSRNPPP